MKRSALARKPGYCSQGTRGAERLTLGAIGRCRWRPSRNPVMLGGGRLRPASSGARILLDCAHNLDGLHRTLGAIEALECDQLRVVFGAVNDKDVRAP